MDDAQYSEVIKDEVNPRSDNCDGEDNNIFVMKERQVFSNI
jgi:hypothetical protein